MDVHGEYRIERHGQVLMVDAEGPWNEEAARQYRRDLEQQIAELVPSPWGMVVVCHGEAVLVPGAEVQMLKITRWRVSQGMRQIAMVFDGVENQPLAEAQFKRV